jgi:hypothetical protein
MKKNSSSKTAQVVAFLKANSEEITVQEISKASDRNLHLRKKTVRGGARKAS